MQQYLSDNIAISALGSHPGYPLLMKALNEAAEEALRVVYGAETHEIERKAISDWRGYKTVLDMISSIIESAKQEVSTENLDPTVIERAPQHFTAADFEKMIQELPVNEMSRLLNDSDTIALGEE